MDDDRNWKNLYAKCKGLTDSIVEKNEKLKETGRKRGELELRYMKERIWWWMTRGEQQKCEMIKISSMRGFYIQRGKINRVYKGRGVKGSWEWSENKRWSTWFDPQILGVVLVNRRCPVWETLPAVSCMVLLWASVGILPLFFCSVIWAHSSFL